MRGERGQRKTKDGCGKKESEALSSPPPLPPAIHLYTRICYITYWRGLAHPAGGIPRQGPNPAGPSFEGLALSPGFPRKGGKPRATWHQH